MYSGKLIFELPGKACELFSYELTLSPLIGVLCSLENFKFNFRTSRGSHFNNTTPEHHTCLLESMYNKNSIFELPGKASKSFCSIATWTLLIVVLDMVEPFKFDFWTSRGGWFNNTTPRAHILLLGRMNFENPNFGLPQKASKFFCSVIYWTLLMIVLGI